MPYAIADVRVVRNNFPRAQRALALDATTRSKQAADLTVENARLLAPVGNAWEHQSPYYAGYLRDSIEAQRVNQYSWTVVAKAFYAVYVELGTSRMPAHPFLVPAAQKVQALVPDLNKALWRW